MLLPQTPCFATRFLLIYLHHNHRIVPRAQRVRHVVRVRPCFAHPRTAAQRIDRRVERGRRVGRPQHQRGR